MDLLWVTGVWIAFAAVFSVGVYSPEVALFASSFSTLPKSRDPITLDGVEFLITESPSLLVLNYTLYYLVILEYFIFLSFS